MGIPIPGVIKAHPFLTVGGVIGVVVIVALLAGGGGNTGEYDAAYATPNDADALSQMGAQLNAAMAQIGAQRDVALNSNATQVTLAGIGADAARYAADKQTELESARLASIERTTIQTSTLAANLKQSEIEAQRFLTERGLLSQEKQTKLLVDSNTKLAEIAAKPKGLFSWLFG